MFWALFCPRRPPDVPREAPGEAPDWSRSDPREAPEAQKGPRKPRPQSSHRRGPKIAPQLGGKGKTMKSTPKNETLITKGI